MKQIPTVKENLENLFEYIIKGYKHNDNAVNGKILFNLFDKDDVYIYTLREERGELKLDDVTDENAGLTVECSVNDWLKLASGRINPVLSAITGRIKFKGNTKMMSWFMSGERQQLKIPADDVTAQEKHIQKYWEKPGKVVIVSGSPRGKNGYTHFLLEKLAEGIKNAGADCKFIELNRYDIRNCTGCWACWTQTDGECVFKDDMKELLETLQESDLIVYGFPVYVDGFPGILKNFIDRQTCTSYPFMVDGLYKTRHPRRKPGVQSMLALSTCGFMELDTFTAVEKHLEKIAHNFHLGFTGFIKVPETSHLFGDPTVYDILTEKLDLLERAGRQIVEYGKIDKKIMKKLSKSSIDKKYIKQWREGANDFWQGMIDEKKNDY